MSRRTAWVGGFAALAAVLVGLSLRTWTRQREVALWKDGTRPVFLYSANAWQDASLWRWAAVLALAAVVIGCAGAVMRWTAALVLGSALAGVAAVLWVWQWWRLPGSSSVRMDFDSVMLAFRTGSPGADWFRATLREGLNHGGTIGIDTSHAVSRAGVTFLIVVLGIAVGLALAAKDARRSSSSGQA